MNKRDIIVAITNYVNSNLPSGATNKSFYIGITNDADDRLFNQHAVEEGGDKWIYCPADTEQIAREVEKYFIDQGLDGGSGGGTDIKYVYCFLQNDHTKR